MALQIIDGNIFTTTSQTIVNPINCVGIMGAGLALEFRLRYPRMYLKYVELCKDEKMQPGLLWIFKSQDKWILNFPTKKHWKFPSKVEYLKSGLEKFVATFQSKNITSAAFPLLGADKGGIDPEFSLELMKRYLEPLEIPIDIYKYNPVAKDDLFDKTKDWLQSNEINVLVDETGIRPQYLRIVLEALENDSIYQLNQLAQFKGIGINTLEKIYVASSITIDQKQLF
jgi:O-acetyl-ADP-ribose deacetylase (regulator of RNase III)